MTIQEIQTGEEDQTFDCKGIQIEPKALAIPIVAFLSELKEVYTLFIALNYE